MTPSAPYFLFCSLLAFDTRVVCSGQSAPPPVKSPTGLLPLSLSRERDLLHRLGTTTKKGHKMVVCGAKTRMGLLGRYLLATYLGKLSLARVQYHTIQYFNCKPGAEESLQ